MPSSLLSKDISTYVFSIVFQLRTFWLAEFKNNCLITPTPHQDHLQQHHHQVSVQGRTAVTLSPLPHPASLMCLQLVWWHCTKVVFRISTGWRSGDMSSGWQSCFYLSSGMEDGKVAESLGIAILTHCFKSMTVSVWGKAYPYSASSG